MPWWAWIVAGIVLAGIEVMAVDLAFYLVFLGVAAIGVGIIEAVSPGLPMWGQWLLYAVLSIVSMVLLRKKLHQRLRGGALPGFDNSSAGTVVDVGEDVPPGLQTRVALRGSKWPATNVDTSVIQAGTKARVVKNDGTTLHIVSLTTSAAAETEAGQAGDS